MPAPSKKKIDYDKNRVDEVVKNYWMQLGDTSLIKTENPFDKRTPAQVEDPLTHVLELMRDPKYFSFSSQHIFNKTPLPIQLAIFKELWQRPFPMLIASRGFGKSFFLALYCMQRMLFCQGVKIVVVGAAFRQAKVIFEYCEEIWNNAPVLRDICGGGSKKSGPTRDIDRCTLRIGDSVALFFPLGDGAKIRGARANIILSDEFASIPNDIFENVVSGFAAVSMSPVEKVQKAARLKALQHLGLLKEAQEDAPSVPGLNSNQTVLSGTAYYGFNHFCHYWKRWKAIIESRGDRRKLEEIFHGEIPEKFDWRDYCVIRIPVQMLPEDFMDSNHVAKAKATIHMSQYLMEYGACFAMDSNGFYKRSLIESCVVGKPEKPIMLPSCGEVKFTAILRGLPGRRYVMSVDPASEKDNLSITILEVWPDHRRIVFQWTTTRNRFKAKLNKGLIKEEDFYGYAARKIRDLMSLFKPLERIAIDFQGGGVAIIEALSDSRRLLPGDELILPVIDDDEPKDTDNLPGKHILEVVQFARAEWVSQANHGMRKDFEDKTLLFPEFDSAVLGLAIEEDKIVGRTEGDEKLYDTLEDCVMEIEELKDELATIVHSQTGTSLRDRWDTPEVKQAGGKKGRLRKDRYSSLLMANMVGRQLTVVELRPEMHYMGGFAHEIVRDKEKRVGRERPTWQNPDWYESGSHEPGYGAVIRRGS